jgi:hypothetical protein
MKKSCENCVYSDRPSYDWPCTSCVTAYDNPPTKWKGIEEQKPKTNADRIRAMSDVELAYWVMCPHDDVCDCPGAPDGDCMKCVLQWLQQPAEEDNHA